MERNHGGMTRRHLLGRAAGAALGGWLAPPLLAELDAKREGNGSPTQVALTAGDSRGDNVAQALRLIESQVRKSLAGKKSIVIKPNCVWASKQLSATHVECLEAILDFLKPLTRQEMVIADSPASGSVSQAYENYGYHRLASKYNVRLVDLDTEPTEIMYVVDERFQPQPVRMAKLLLDPDTYIVSAAVMKTHDRVVATLSLKNVVVGPAVKAAFGPEGKVRNDKWVIHGGPHNEGIHYNLFSLARRLRPDLAVIDGYQGMEGNGPISGTPVDHKVALASTDWLAADRVAVTLMGLDFAKIGYLAFCAREGLGQANLDKIEVLGARIADHVRHYRPHDNIEQQYKWMQG